MKNLITIVLCVLTITSFNLFGQTNYQNPFGGKVGMVDMSPNNAEEENASTLAIFLNVDYQEKGMTTLLQKYGEEYLFAALAKASGLDLKKDFEIIDYIIGSKQDPKKATDYLQKQKYDEGRKLKVEKAYFIVHQESCFTTESTKKLLDDVQSDIYEHKNPNMALTAIWKYMYGKEPNRNTMMYFMACFSQLRTDF